MLLLHMGLNNRIRGFIKSNNFILKQNTYLEIITLSITFSAELARVPLPFIHIWLDMLPTMLLQVTLLSESFPTPLASEGFDSLMHADVIEQVPRLLDDPSTANVPSLVLDYFFLLMSVVISECFISIFSQEFNVEFVFLLFDAIRGFMDLAMSILRHYTVRSI